MCYTNQLQPYFKLTQQILVEKQNKQNSLLCEFLIQKHLVCETALQQLCTGTKYIWVKAASCF